jgi:hypothetical protein
MENAFIWPWNSFVESEGQVRLSMVSSHYACLLTPYAKEKPYSFPESSLSATIHESSEPALSEYPITLTARVFKSTARETNCFRGEAFVSFNAIERHVNDSASSSLPSMKMKEGHDAFCIPMS